jgi:hypothetical protein
MLQQLVNKYFIPSSASQVANDIAADLGENPITNTVYQFKACSMSARNKLAKTCADRSISSAVVRSQQLAA